MKKLSFIAAIMALFLCGCEKNPDNGGQEPQPGTLSFSGTMTVVFRGETVPSEDVELTCPTRRTEPSRCYSTR